MSGKWSDLAKRYAGILALIGFVLLAIGVSGLDGASSVSVWALATSLLGMLLLGVGVLELFSIYQ